MPGTAEKNKGEWTCLRPVWPPPATGGFFSGAICSPPPAKPCGSVPGSKIFTEIPRRRPRPAAFTAARFAPRPPAKPCGSVPGSKIFTAIPRRRPRPVGFSAARFAPRSPQSLAAPFRGAKSSQRFRAAACHRRPFKLDPYNFFSETLLTRGKKSL